MQSLRFSRLPSKLMKRTNFTGCTTALSPVLRNRFLRGNELVDDDDEVSAYVSGAVLDTGDLIGEQEPSVEDFPGGPVVKNLPVNVGDTGSIPGLGKSHQLRSN